MSLVGFKNKEGEVVIPARYSVASSEFFEYLAWAADPFQQVSGYIRPDGEWAFTVPGHTHFDVMDGMAKYQVIGTDGYPMYGYVATDGNLVITANYHKASYFINGYARVERRTLVGSIADGISSALYIDVSTPWDEKVIIIDKNGKPARLPSRQSY